MTIQQLRIALEAAKTGSITRAARTLYLSQPNASSMLRTLEQELGYEIFNRTNTGIVPTEAGMQFLDHAVVILAQMQDIYAIRDRDRVRRLRLGIQSYSPAVEAFLKLAREYRDSPDAELKCINISADDGIRALYGMKLDVVAALISSFMLPLAEQTVRNHGLELVHLRDLPVYLNLRRGHPLLERLPPNADEFDYRLLEQYPYVEYQKLPVRARSTRPSEAPTRCGLGTASPWTSATRAAASSPRRTRSPWAATCRRPCGSATGWSACPYLGKACTFTASPGAATGRGKRSRAT